VLGTIQILLSELNVSFSSKLAGRELKQITEVRFGSEILLVVE